MCRFIKGKDSGRIEEQAEGEETWMESKEKGSS